MYVLNFSCTVGICIGKLLEINEMDTIVEHKNPASINHWFNRFFSFKKRMIGFLLNAELVTYVC